MVTVRRGLPRIRGGEAWPPAGVDVDEAGAAAHAVADPAASVEVVESVVEAAASASEGAPAAPVSAPNTPAVSAPAPATGAGLRRGLPRTAGGDPWPPAGAVTAAVPSVATDATAVPAAAVAGTPVASAAAPAPSPAARPAAAASSGAALRRGLPRTVGGDPWPPAGTAAALTADEVLVAADGALVETVIVAGEAPSADLARVDVSTPLPFTRTVWPGTAPRHAPPGSDAEPSRRRPTWTQAIAGLFGAAALAVVAGAAVAFVRAFLALPFMQDFLTAFPGEYHPAIEVAPGFAPWIGWQHFFNVFLMVLIIRSGLRVRSEKRPTVFWTPRGAAKGKISLTLWFHQALDLLWIVNGVVFVVLLFVTGAWVRIVPTSWEVFPNALSAALQYISFDWPTENGWVNYNSLQQLAYFTIVFLAAPLAIVTGFRMSGLWPKKAERLSKAYPVEWARAVHFPTMLFFSLFIVAHVALVLLTGMLRNLNHMYASQDAVGWTGFWVFVLSLVVIAAAWVAARPLVLAPIAKLFGQVSGR